MGILFVLIGFVVLISPDKLPEDYIFGSLYMLGGLASITYINRLIIDPNTQELVHQRGLLFPFLFKRYPLPKIRAVKVSMKVEGNGDNKTTRYPVSLNGIKDAVVLKHGNPWFSRVRAEQLARLINKPLVNRVYGISSTRKPDELDMPLIERWIRNDERFEKPSLTHATTLLETVHGSSYELSIRAQFPTLKYVMVFLFLLVIPAVVDVPWAEFFHSRGYRLFAIFPLVAGLLMLAFVGRSRLRITASEVTFRQGFFPVRARLRIEDIEEMFIASDGITLVGDANAVWIHWGGNKQDSEYLEAVVPYQILRLGRYGAHNYSST